MHILLFGGTGCVGTALDDVCTQAGVRLTAPGRAQVDVTNQRQLQDCVRDTRADVVIDCTALVGINPCEQHPDTAFLMHAVKTHWLLTASRDVGSAFVFTSSHAVFDGCSDQPYDETSPPLATSAYAASKLAGEQMTLALHPQGYVVRFPTLFGRRRNQVLGFVDKMAVMLLQGKSPTVAADKIDSPTYALDAAGALLETLGQGTPGLYHLCNAGQTSYHGLICRLRDRLGLSQEIGAGKDADFPALAPKPLRTAMVSLRRPPLRRWEDALDDWIATDRTALQELAR